MAVTGTIVKNGNNIYRNSYGGGGGFNEQLYSIPTGENELGALNFFCCFVSFVFFLCSFGILRSELNVVLVSKFWKFSKILIKIFI